MKNILEMRTNFIKNKQLEELKNKKCVVICIHTQTQKLEVGFKA